jgi:two-component system sensor kinase FixL
MDATSNSRAESKETCGPSGEPIAWLESALGALADGVIGLDEIGRIRLVNPAAAHLLGWEAESIRGQSVKVLLPPERGAEHDAHLASYLQTGESAVVGHARSVRLLGRDGSVVPVHLSISDLELAGRRLLLGILRQAAEGDRTDRLERYASDLEGRAAELLKAQRQRQVAQAALEASEKRIRVLLDQAPDPILTVDESERLVGFNASAERSFGCTPEAALGRPVRDFLPDWDALVSRDEPRTETLARRADGQSFQAEIGASLSEVGGAKLRTLIIRDVTERHLAEMRIRYFSRELERSNRELDAFAYVASHDLQEPLRKIRTFGERLREHARGALDDKSLDYLGRMEDAAGRMRELIDGLLAYARVSSRSEAFVRVSLEEVVRGVLSDLEVKIDDLGAKVEIDPLPTIDADRTQMRQLFQNLIGNALKFQREGVRPEVRVRVEPAEGSAAPDTVRVRVEDNGIGFEPQYAERLFQMFERLHSRSEYEGTGIGLAVCKRIVDRHGGRIEARSEEGRGAVFVIDLPLRQAAAEDTKELA